MASNTVLTCIYLCMTMSALFGTVQSFTCPCKNDVSGCVRPRTHANNEVFVVSDGKSDYTKWSWDSLTSVLATEDSTNKELMCYAHKKSKKFGFFANMKYEDHFGTDNTTSKKWIKKIDDKRTEFAADIVAVNLIDILPKLETDDDVNKFKTILMEFHKSLTSALHKSMPVELICVVPWNPPCQKQGCPGKITDQTLYRTCDLILLDATSFEVLDTHACKARATVPFTHLALGVDEYVAQGIPEKRIVLGVPWHGFKYSCENFRYEGEQDDPCLLKTTINEKNNTVCDVKNSRVRISIGEMMDKHKDEVPKSHWSTTFQAPVFLHYDKDTKSYTQIWYENIMSLRMKYQYAHDFSLKGIALYYAEDLSNSSAAPSKGFNGAMWDWVLHGIIQTTVKQPPPVKYHAGVVAGAAIGCLMLGLVLGIVLTWLGLRRCVKKDRQIPFKRDHIEYHDEDDNLHL